MKLAIVFLGIPLSYDRERYYSHASILNMLCYFSEFFDVELVCPVVSGSGEGHEVDTSKMKIYHLPGWKSGKDLYFRKFFSVMAGIKRVFSAKAKNWDIVWIVDPDPLSQFTFLLTRLYHLPRVLYLRGNDAFEIMNRSKKGIKRLLAWIWCNWLKFAIPFMLKYSLGIVTGKVLYEKYKKVGGKLLTLYASSVTTKDLIRAKRRTRNDDKLKLLMVGNLVSYKCVDLALKAVKNLIDKGLDIRFDVIGDGTEKDALRLLCRQLGLTDVVTFTGFVPYGEVLFTYYANADVLLLPSESEGTPKVVPEAFSFGLPIIASRVGGVPDMVKDGYNGLLIAPGSQSELTFAIEKMMTSENVLKTLSEGAMASASEYTVELQIGRIAEEIRRLGC